MACLAENRPKVKVIASKLLAPYSKRMNFKLVSPYKPTGDQPQAIEELTSGLKAGMRDQTLLGVTGSGKTFSMANVVANLNRPTLVISHNKTLAAQLASEFREFFPNNAVHYFVSYYDYYQPEAYVPQSDTYIEKETQLNEEIDRLRHASTQALLSRRDVLIVASVSCIYGLGSPETYKSKALTVKRGTPVQRTELLLKLIGMQYHRNDTDFARGSFRVRGDTVEVFPAFSDHNAYQFQFFGDQVEKITEIDSLTGDVLDTFETIDIYPATHYLPAERNFDQVVEEIAADMKTEVAALKKLNKLVEAQRLEQRTKFDLDMLRETGYVNGVENYSRYFDQRKAGEPPYTLLDYFPKDFLMFVDESHMTIPQIGGMYAGDRSRKQVLVDYGFRLKAAMDNRPLNFKEFEQHVNQVVYVSATPSSFELQKSKQVVEQLIRPTGLLDPVIELRPSTGQVRDVVKEIKARIEKRQRVLVTTLTKRMSEELTEFLRDQGIKVQYLHSDVDTLERLEILRDLRLGTYDVLVGINLLREGLDLPEVSLVVILDADKEGFLRSETALVQTIGRAARHLDGRVIMYADRVTRSMKAAMDETTRRRKQQETYNKKHEITPKSIEKKIREDRLSGMKVQVDEAKQLAAALPPTLETLPVSELEHLIKDLEQHMEMAAQNLEFEKAAVLRDQINELTEGMRRKKKVKPKKRGRT